KAVYIQFQRRIDINTDHRYRPKIKLPSTEACQNKRKAQRGHKTEGVGMPSGISRSLRKKFPCSVFQFFVVVYHIKRFLYFTLHTHRLPACLSEFSSPVSAAYRLYFPSCPESCRSPAPCIPRSNKDRPRPGIFPEAPVRPPAPPCCSGASRKASL